MYTYYEQTDTAGTFNTVHIYTSQKTVPLYTGS